jgi:hypothetical protein
MLYYNNKFFTSRVDRKVSEPSKLYWRVRSAFVIFGTKLDAKTKQVLFNKAALGKANTILTEILQGFYSDLPGISFYKLKLDKKGNIRKDKRGIELIECSRELTI